MSEITYPELEPIPEGSAAPQAPSASGQVTYPDLEPESGPAPPPSKEPTYKGALANAPSDYEGVSGTLAAQGKLAATAGIQGVTSSVTGGGLEYLADLGLSHIEAAARAAGHYFNPSVEQKSPDQIYQELQQQKAAMEQKFAERRGFALPQTGQEAAENLQKNIFSQTGAYEPTNPVERYEMAGLAGAAGMVAPGPGMPGSAAIPKAAIAAIPRGGSLFGATGAANLPAAVAGARGAALSSMPAGAVGATAAQATQDITGDPLAGAAAGMLAPAVGGFAANKMGVNQAIEGAFKPRVAAGKTLLSIASDPAALAASAAKGPRPEDTLIPGSNPTLFQAEGDQGLGQYERGLRTVAPADFLELQGEQNRARIAALKAANPAAASGMDLADFVTNQYNQIDDLGDRYEQAGQRDLDTLNAALPSTLPPEARGADARNALLAQAALTKQRANDIRSAIEPIPGTLNLVSSGIRDRAQQLVDAIRPTDEQMGQKEGPINGIFKTAQGLPDVSPFLDVEAFRKRVNAGMTEYPYGSPEWAMLSQLRGAVGDSVTNAVGNQIAMEQRAVAAGTLDPANTIASRIHNVMTGPVPTAGSTVYTPAGRQVGVNYGVVDAGNLTTSHDDNFRPNPDYPAGLQPRDRTRAANQVQVQNIAANLQPERLGASVMASDGAPIVGPDGVVESGNGRVMAIRQAYADNGPQAQAYRDFLAKQGFDTTGMARPVLVRQRTSDLTPEDRVAFAQEANASPTASMSATERARQDAGRMSDALVNSHDGETALTSRQNAPFVRGFVDSVADPSEVGSMVTKDGLPSIEGQTRIRNALVSAAYDDPALVSSLAESGDEGMRVFGGALSDIAPNVAKLRRAVASGDVAPQADLSQHLVEAARVSRQARENGIPLRNVVAQQDAFHKISPEAMAVLHAAYGDNLTGRMNRFNFAKAMRSAVDEAGKQTNDARLFGEQPLSARQILGGRRNAGVENGEEVGVGAVNPDEGIGANGGRGGGPGQGAGRTQTPGGRGRNRESVVPPAEIPELVPNATPETAGRINAAAAAWKDYKQTYGENALGVGDVLGRHGYSEFKTPKSGVPSKLLVAGDKGGETIDAFLKANQGNPTGLTALHGMVADLINAKAVKNGQVQPNLLDGLKRTYAQAFSRIPPEVIAPFENAASAQERLGQISALRKQQSDAYKKSAFGKLIGAPDSATVDRMVGGMFKGDRASPNLGALADEAAKDRTGAATAGLQSSVMDYIGTRFLKDIFVGNEKEAAINAGMFQRFVRDNNPMLRKVLKPDQANTLNAISDDLARANQSIVNKPPGTPGTAADVLAHFKNVGDKKEALIWTLGKALWGAREVGELVGHEGIAGWLGPLAGAVAVGARVRSALKAVGIHRVSDLVKEGILNHDVGRALVLRASNATAQNTLAGALERAAQRAMVSAGAMRSGFAEGGLVGDEGDNPPKPGNLPLGAVPQISPMRGQPVPGMYQMPIGRNGTMEFKADDPDKVTLRGAYLPDEERGSGLGVQGYQKLADWAHSTGRPLHSEDTSAEAARVFAALKRRGYDVTNDQRGQFVVRERRST